MSRICFHTKDSEAEVYGSERAHMSVTISDITYGLMQSMTEWWEKGGPRILNHIPKEHYLHENWFARRNMFSHNFRTYLAVDNGILLLDSVRISIFELTLNTVIAIGNDPLKLFARIHGQCEIHCYIMPNNFEWFGNMVKQGLESGLYRKDMNWESLLKLIENTKDSPIVMSYSVCEQFPNRNLTGHGDEWYDLSSEECWEMSMNELLEQNETMQLEITPKNWDNYYFGNGLTAFDFLNYKEK